MPSLRPAWDISITPSQVATVVFWYLPAVLIVPYLRLPVPTYRPRSEVAGAFQALAFARDPITSFFYMTPEESLTALHLHSILSSPLVAAGYIEGGRLVSFLAALVTVAVCAGITSRLFDRKAALIAPLALWAQPAFLRSAHRFRPESLSILLTAAALWMLLVYDDTGDRRWFHGSLALLVLAPTVHLWEATILLPMVALVAYRRDIRDVVLTVAAGASSVLVIRLVRSLQPRPASLMDTYATFSGNWNYLLEPGFWFKDAPAFQYLFHIYWLHDYRFIVSLMLPIGAIAALGWSIKTLQSPSRRSVVMAAWLWSALSIPFGFTRGYIGHDYYLWALTVPVALTLAVACLKGVYWVLQAIPEEHQSAIAKVFYIEGCVALILFVVVVQVSSVGLPAGLFPAADGPAVDAGQDLRDYDAAATEIAFIGEYGDRPDLYANTDYARILIYGQVLVKHRRYDAATGPSIVTDGPPPDCSVVVEQLESGYNVGPC